MITTQMVLMTDLNAHQTLFGGKLMSWMDLAAAIFCANIMGKCVTINADQIVFKVPAHLGDIIEFHVDEIKRGTTSLTVKVTAIKKNKENREGLEMASSSFTFVGVDDNGNKSYAWNDRVQT